MTTADGLFEQWVLEEFQQRMRTWPTSTTGGHMGHCSSLVILEADTQWTCECLSEATWFHAYWINARFACDHRPEYLWMGEASYAIPQIIREMTMMEEKEQALVCLYDRSSEED